MRNSPRTPWGREPLIVPRWVLTSIYAGFVILGVVAILVGSPTLDLTSPDGYTLLWGIGVGSGAAGAGVGSLTDRWHVLEKWALLVMLATLLFYTLSTIWLVFAQDMVQAEGRGVFTVIVVMVTLLPAYRLAVLVRKTGL